MISYHFNGQRLRYYTGISVNANHFYPESENPVHDDINAIHKNQKLNLIRKHIGNIEIQYLATGETITPEKIKIKLDEVLKSRPSEIVVHEVITLGKYIDLYIENLKIRTNIRTGAKLSAALPRKYGTVRTVFNEFCTYKNKQYDFQDIDKAFCTEFVAFMLSEKKFATNTYGRIIRFLKTILKEAETDDYPVNPKYKLLKGVTEPTDSVYFSEAELERIETLDLSNCERLDVIRDMFLIGCWTGMRFEDFINLKTSDINMEHGRIRVIAQKTHSRVVIPMHPTVKRIIEKYDYKLPKPRTNQKFNKYIKEVVELAEIKELFTKHITKGGIIESTTKPKFEWASSHDCRRSFATNACKRRIPVYLIMATTGHKTESEFWKYIKLDQDEKADLFAESANWG